MLMNWLVQVHSELALLPETLFLGSNYVDRYLSRRMVSKDELPLVAMAAILIAWKYAQASKPVVQEIIDAVGGIYTVDKIVEWERYMLSALQYDLGWPGPMVFLQRISEVDDGDVDTQHLAQYFVEVALMDERFVARPPSLVVAASYCLAGSMRGKEARETWVCFTVIPCESVISLLIVLQTTRHISLSEYTYVQLRPLLLVILECCMNPPKHHVAVSEKYFDASTFVAARLSESSSRTTVSS